MRCVIQCAGSKRAEAQTFRTSDGRSVTFVANPKIAPAREGILYAHPDDPSDQEGLTWRDRVKAMNTTGGVHHGFLSAGQLYRPPAYAQLLSRLDVEKLFILSAGWGLIRADFYLPNYDITFSQSAEPWKRRRRQDFFKDFNALADATSEDTFFLGGQDYLPLYLNLTRGGHGRYLVLYNSAVKPVASGCIVTRYSTPRRTNWHYDCAKAFAAGHWKPDFEAVSNESTV